MSDFALSTEFEDNRLIGEKLINFGLLGFLERQKTGNNKELLAFDITFDKRRRVRFYTLDESKERFERRDPIRLPSLGFASDHPQPGYHQLHRYRLNNPIQHVYFTNPTGGRREFAGFVDESYENPIFIKKIRENDDLPLYIYSDNASLIDSFIPLMDDLHSPASIGYLSRFIQEAGMPSSLFTFVQDQRSVTVSLNGTPYNFYINHRPGNIYTVRPNPAIVDNLVLLDIHSKDTVAELLMNWLSLPEIAQKKGFSDAEPVSASHGPIRQGTQKESESTEPVLSSGHTIVSPDAVGENDKAEADVGKGLENEESSSEREQTFDGRSTRYVRRNKMIGGTIGVKEQSEIFLKLIDSIPPNESGLLLGIFGRWGRGKTFFWSQVKNLFAERASANEKTPNSQVNGGRLCNYEWVEFHAWKYQDTSASWAYLYELCAETFFKGRITGWHWFDTALNKCRLNIARYGWFNFVGSICTLLFGLTWCFFIDISTKWNIVYKGISLLGIGVGASILMYWFYHMDRAAYILKKYFANKHFSDLLGIQAELQREFLLLFGTWVSVGELGHKRVIIFVDDIDRCHEERIIAVIDSLKVMMDNDFISQRVMVIAAVDESVLKRAIKLKYHKMVTCDLALNKRKKSILLEKLCREYMDKLFISGFKLGTLSNDEKKDVLKELTKGKVNEVAKHFGESSISIGVDAAPSQLNNGTTVSQDTLSAHATTAKQQLETQNQGNKPIVAKDSGRDGRLHAGNHMTDVFEEFEITEHELNYLLKTLDASPEATPRFIQLFYYRYQLAKQFKEQIIDIRPHLIQEWRKFSSKEVLCYLLVEYSVSGDVALQKAIGDARNLRTEVVKFEILGTEFSMSNRLYLSLLKIIEIVVPY